MKKLVLAIIFTAWLAALGLLLVLKHLEGAILFTLVCLYSHIAIRDIKDEK